MMKRALFMLNCMLLSVGNCGGPLMIRLYFIHGGKRVWLSAWLQTAGWPFILILLAINYSHRRGAADTGVATKLFHLKPPLFLAAVFIGLLTGFDNYLYAYGVARLPISTSALIIATQLAFTAGFAFLLVKQKLSPYSINAVVLLTFGAGVLAMHANNDKPVHEPDTAYVFGFLLTIGAAALYGLILPLMELTYKKSKQEINYTLVMEFQMIICLFSTIFCSVGMLINKDFKEIEREAKYFGIGESKYYVVLVCISTIWQCFFLGVTGVIFCASSLQSGIMIAVLLPVTEILALIFYREKFQAEKGVALALSLWGFVSYFYGEVKGNKRKKAAASKTVQISNPAVGNV